MSPTIHLGALLAIFVGAFAGAGFGVWFLLSLVPVVIADIFTFLMTAIVGILALSAIMSAIDYLKGTRSSE